MITVGPRIKKTPPPWRPQVQPVRVHMERGLFTTGLKGGDALRALETLRALDPGNISNGPHRAVVRRNQLCSGFGLRYRDGWTGLFAEIGAGGQLRVAPDVVAEDSVYCQVVKTLWRMVSRRIDLQFTGAIGRLEVFAAVLDRELSRVEDVARRLGWASRLIPTVKRYRWEFHGVRIDLPRRKRITADLVAYPVPPSDPDASVYKVELKWQGSYGQWHDEQLICRTMQHHLRRILMTARVSALDVHRLARNGHWRGRGQQIQVGPWERRALRFFSAYPGRSAREFAAHAGRVWGKGPAKRARMLRALVQRGLITATENDGYVVGIAW